MAGAAIGPAPAASMTFRLGVLALAALLYAWLLTGREMDLFGPERFGLAYNSMLDHMLRGRWDVDPAVIGFEAFVHDGRSYAYFGPFPALLRLPLVVMSDWQAIHVERLSCLIAMLVGIGAQTSAVLTSLSLSGLSGSAAPVARRFAPPLVVVCAFSGAPMLLGPKGGLIYHEAILWAWALAMLFVMLALPAIQGRDAAGWRRLCGLGVCAGLCLLTRSSTGAGLYLASGLLLLDGLVRDRAGGAWRRVWAPSCVLGAFLLLTGVVNQGRWGNPLMFANLRAQTALVAMFPERLARLEQYGLFNWRRADVGILYYVLPIWTERLEQAHPIVNRFDELFDGIEQPATSLLLTDPAWCVLSAIGIGAIVRRRAKAREMLVALALAVPAAMMLIAWYMAFRYRIEFEPLLVLLSCIGLRSWAPGLSPRALGPAALLVSALCLCQIVGATVAGHIYALQSLGPTQGYAALSLRCSLAPAACLPSIPETRLVPDPAHSHLD